ncbi:unnamed protein product [Ectocarpus sp. 13 AM-2016]
MSPCSQGPLQPQPFVGAHVHALGPCCCQKSNESVRIANLHPTTCRLLDTRSVRKLRSQAPIVPVSKTHTKSVRTTPTGEGKRQPFGCWKSTRTSQSHSRQEITLARKAVLCAVAVRAYARTPTQRKGTKCRGSHFAGDGYELLPESRLRQVT